MLETPSWLLAPPTGGGVPLPVQTLNQLLPLHKLGWEDFERLCLRLLKTEVNTVRRGLYGVPGQAQHGIDVYAIAPTTPDEAPNPRPYVTLQSRRIKPVTPAALYLERAVNCQPFLERAVNYFLEANWADVSQKFIYSTSSSTRATQLLDKIEDLAERLGQWSIEFEVWDQETISEKLKERPELVHDFFGRPWVKAFCGEAAADQLGNRLDAGEMAELRRELARVYAATFRLADPGFAGFGLSEFRRIDLLERLVTPDLISAARQTAAYPYSVAMESEAAGRTLAPYNDFTTAEEWNAWLPGEYSWSVASVLDQVPRAQPFVSVERRPADQWIGTERLQVIIGDPGAGKSALLRYLVLDLLREDPQWKAVSEHWGEYLPVWLPFHFFAQKVVGRTGESATVALAIKSWLEQNESAQIWPLVEKALDDSRLLLVVDGLDEWTSDDAAHYAARAVERFAAVRGIPVVASTRPYGLSKLTLDGGWVYSRIAPLTYDQQRFLATHYFRAVADSGSSATSAEMIGRLVDEFLEQVHLVPELSAFSGTPLFLILLVMLRLSGSSTLPAQRFDVYDRAVQLLVAELPSKRRIAADITAPRQGLPDHELRAVLSKVSYVNQLRGNVSTLEEDPLRKDFVDALQDPAHLAMSQTDAVIAANQLLDVAEGELGLLVRTGPNQLGFIHRVMQEQLAAEHVASRLEFTDVIDLFDKYVGNPVWKEVLLITFRSISRLSEQSGLLTTIRSRIDENPAGLRAREFLAEITFGSYRLPADTVRTNAEEIIDVVETHAYGPHRARLLDAVLTGVSGPLTGNIVRDCLERWTLSVHEPSRELVAQIALIPPDTGLSDTVCNLLVCALRNADRYAAFDNACTIAVRCSTIGTDEERYCLRVALMNILEDPPSGLVQAAALTALALGWRDDPTVDAILNEARSHSDEQVRLVATSDALSVLTDVFPEVTGVSRPDAQPITDTEREWLIEHLRTQEIPEVHFGMVVAAISAVVRDDRSVLADLLALQSSDADYLGSAVTRAVMLTAFGDDESVVDWVCTQIRGDGQYGLKLQIMVGDVTLLARTYHIGSAHNGRVAESIECFLRGSDVTGRDRTLFGLAAVDQGPVIREALLEDLATSSTPHWAASALAEHFDGDADVRAELEAIVMGDPERASMVANVASRVVGPEDVIPRLMDILRALAATPASNHARCDIVASALVQAHREQGLSDPPVSEHFVQEAIDLIPESLHWIYGDPRLALAAEFYPVESAAAVLNELAERDDRPLEVFLQVFRQDPEKLKPFLAEAAKVLRSLPAYLRAHVCRTLAERGIEPRLVSELTARWADERSDPNKSVASFAYHQALAKVKQIDPGNGEAWNSALAQLGDQAAAYGPDYEARRRAAWVGMCVLEDWSPVLGRMETIGDSVPVNVSLHDYLNGPDRVLLQQIAAAWEQLRSTFGDELIARLSGRREELGQNLAWNALALVAEEHPTLERELEDKVVANPQLRTWPGIFLWTLRRGAGNSAVVIEDILHFLRGSDYAHDEAIHYLLAEPQRIGIQPEQLRSALEKVVKENPEGHALESLAVLVPDHPMVMEASRELSELREANGNSPTHHVSPRTYFALTYAVSPSDEILALIQRHHNRLGKVGIPYVDRVFARHVSHRLRRDRIAADRIREIIVNPNTQDSLVAVLASLLGNAVGLDDELLAEIERRIIRQTDRRLATVVRDPHAGFNLPVRAILLGVAEGARDAVSRTL